MWVEMLKPNTSYIRRYEMHKLMSRLVLFTAMTVCLLLLTQSISYAGAVPNGLAGVPWGATREQVKKIMIEKGFKQENATPFSNEPSAGLVFYGSFANRMCYLEFTFIGNSFYFGTVRVESWALQPVLGTFDHFVSIVTDKYGVPEKRESFEGLTKGIKMQHAEWTFRDNASLDVYTIRATTIDAIFVNDRTLYTFLMVYEAKSLGNRLKEDGI
jgi:hypothetical protein